MAQWNDGYVTDLTYTSGFFRELSPSWLSFAALLLGHRAPDIAQPFRWAELGCGNGFTACLLAAANPHAEFWGFDFNPAHVENARVLAAAAGIGNVQFQDASFAELAEAPDAALPMFDFMIAHGVYSWISPANRAALVAVIRRRLAAAGFAYVSYNVLAGWASMLPVRRLMRAWADAHPAEGPRDLAPMLDFLDRLRKAGAGLFAGNPALDSRLDGLRGQDQRYVVHEYLNRDWTPVASADVAAELQSAKCSFIGSATLSENIDVVSVPSGMVPLLQEARDPVLREMLRDAGSAQGFRRDIFRRGVNPMVAREHLERLDRLSLLGLGRPAGGEVKFVTAVGEVAGKQEIYEPLLSMLDAGPLSFRAARQSGLFVNDDVSEALQAFALLVSGGYAHPAVAQPDSPAALQSASRANLGLTRSSAHGGALATLVAPAIGSALAADPIEVQIVADRLAGTVRPTEELAAHIIAELAANGRGVQKDGTPVTDPAEGGRIVAAAVGTFLERRAPVLRRLGVLPG